MRKLDFRRLLPSKCKGEGAALVAQRRDLLEYDSDLKIWVDGVVVAYVVRVYVVPGSSPGSPQVTFCRLGHPRPLPFRVTTMRNLSKLFNGLPPTLILKAHYQEEELDQLRKVLEDHGCLVTTSIFHAGLAITKLTQEKRVRREVYELARTQGGSNPSATGDIDVIKEKWIRKSIDEERLVDWPFEDSHWRVAQIPAIQPISPPKRARSQNGEFAVPGTPASKRKALSRTGSNLTTHGRPSAVSSTSFESASSEDPTSRHFHPASQASTNASSGEDDDQFDYRDVFSCRRKTPLISRNEDFVKLLMEIRLARELALYNFHAYVTDKSDQIGVRAYSSAIAALKAYPHKLNDPNAISKLPGCGSKIVSIYKEFLRTGTFSEYTHLQDSWEFQTLKLFWGVWGVGAHTARQWYFDKAWRSLDDVIEGAWDTLPRVQQIGIKYYEEFNEHKISRSEVEEIGRIVGNACEVVAAGTVYEICGGYRRGKSESGDVDIIISNPTPHSTQNLCLGLVKVLEERGIITHTLTISTATSKREENQKHSFRQRPALGSGETRGYGLDSLDKALVVFLLPKDNPHYTGIHRRVDLIIAPWRAWGTAIVGWTGAMTFERDVRLWAKKKKGFKFDSGGLTDRKSGQNVQVEPKKDANAVEAEKMVFERLGLDYIPPALRNTG